MKLKDRLSVTMALFPEKPKKRYHKYNSKVKDSHLLLHRMGNDIGYPQQVLFKPKSQPKSKDYQVLNKKKISDSILTPVETRRVSIQRQKYRLDPKKLLVYRKNQMKLKENTKILLQRDLSEIQFTQPVEFILKNTESGFYQHQYRKQQSSLSMSMKGKNKKLHHPLVHQRESISQQLNLSRLNKTEKIRAISDKTTVDRYFNSSNKWASKMKNQSERLIEKEQEKDKLDWANKRRFKEIIIRLKQYHKIFQGSISQAEVDLNIQTQMLKEEKKMNDQAAREKILMQKIDDFARGKKEDIIWKNYHHLNDLQDLKKINPKFYDELTRGRKKRYQLLKLDLKRIESISPQKKVSYKIRQISQISSSLDPQMLTQQEQQVLQQYINNTQWLQQRSARRKQYQFTSKLDKLILFLNQFGKVRLSAQIFGVPLDMVYYSMLHLPEPFSLEGSFLFFKAVAANDVETVKIFVEQFPKVMHQIDDLGRTCLILSTECNFTEMSRILIEVGLNLDIQSVKGMTALTNAIKHANLDVILLLLEHGASPWSQRQNILQYNRNQTIYKLIKQARRLSLGMKTMKSRHRYSFWQSVKHQLRQQIVTTN